MAYQGLNYRCIDVSPGSGASSVLMLAAQGGDRTAFQELVRSYEAAVTRVALNLTGSENAAQQIYCSVFTDAFISVNQLRPGSSVFLWIHRILVRHCVEFCRQRHAQRNDAKVACSDVENRLRNAILALSPLERVIFELKQRQGLKVATLAEIFDVTPEFIINKLQNARTHLRRACSS